MNEQSTAQTYTSKELETASGVPVRTLHDWVAKKVLPKPRGSGRGARYLARHLIAARVVRHLREQGRSLPEIRAQIGGLAEQSLLDLLPQAAGALAAEGAPNTSAASDAVAETAYPAKTLEVVELMDGLTLMVQLDRGWMVRRVAEDIYRQFRARR
jgi:DNA-binding transcriptional MerR regulator